MCAHFLLLHLQKLLCQDNLSNFKREGHLTSVFSLVLSGCNDTDVLHIWSATDRPYLPSPQIWPASITPANQLPWKNTLQKPNCIVVEIWGILCPYALWLEVFKVINKNTSNGTFFLIWQCYREPDQFSQTCFNKGHFSLFHSVWYANATFYSSPLQSTGIVQLFESFL